ncbi:MAG: hypothetical protein HYY02_07890 [Chloroflexi bacterium]|nr:hypothetical protein [Chloroflexota bacterium]
MYDSYYERGLTDGLPIIPPTPERVQAMLEHAGRSPEERLGIVPPNWVPATVQKAAVNAVMAGCRPEYFPVVLAALEALTDEKFNLYGVQATTEPDGPMVIVNGPVRNEIGMNCGYNCLGQGNRANATIGRAVRLCLINIGGGRPGQTDRATQGFPGKYTFCFGENEEESPWPPLHADRGYDRTASAVTMVAAEGSINIGDAGSKSAESLLTTIAGSITAIGANSMMGGEIVLVMCPEHARTIARDGWSKEDAKHFLYEKANVPLAVFPLERAARIQERFPDLLAEDSHGELLFPAVKAPENVVIVVAGGGGAHTTFCPTWGAQTRSITRRVR